MTALFRVTFCPGVFFLSGWLFTEWQKIGWFFFPGGFRVVVFIRDPVFWYSNLAPKSPLLATDLWALFWLVAKIVSSGNTYKCSLDWTQLLPSETFGYWNERCLPTSKEGMYEGKLILMAIHEASKALDRPKHIFFIDKTWKQRFFILLFIACNNSKYNKSLPAIEILGSTKIWSTILMLLIYESFFP